MRRRLALGLVVGTAVLAGCGGGGGGDTTEHVAGGTPRSFYGVISADPFLDGPTLARLGRGGVGTLRVNFGWGSRAAVLPTTGPSTTWRSPGRR